MPGRDEAPQALRPEEHLGAEVVGSWPHVASVCALPQAAPCAKMQWGSKDRLPMRNPLEGPATAARLKPGTWIWVERRPGWAGWDGRPWTRGEGRSDTRGEGWCVCVCVQRLKRLCHSLKQQRKQHGREAGKQQMHNHFVA